MDRFSPSRTSISSLQHRQYRHYPPARQEAHIHFSTSEIIYILVSMVTLILAFQIFKVSDTGIILGVVIGITLHELGHKVVAQSFGFESRYKLWEIGLVLVIAFAIITKGRFIFAAPGFVVTDGEATEREIGIVSLSAPAMNICLAILFLFIKTPWSASAAYVNALLAIFNLLPIEPLDGAKVLQWSSVVWSAAFVLSIVLGVILLLGYF